MAKDYLVAIQREQSDIDYTHTTKSEITVTFSFITKDGKYDTFANGQQDFMNELAGLCRRIKKEFHDKLPTQDSE